MIGVAGALRALDAATARAAVTALELTAPARSSDPLGPSPIDPERARSLACEVTAPPTACVLAEPTATAPVEPSSTPPSVGWLGLVGQALIVVLVVALVAVAVWAVARRGSLGRVGDDDDADADLDEDLDGVASPRAIDHETPPDRWRRRAAEARAGGDLREAVRCEYRALVGDLARAGHVDEIPGRTSGEERAQLAELAPGLGERGRDVVERFGVAADTFDAAWFDDAEVTADDDERFLAAARAVLAVLGPAASGARSRR